MEDRSSGGSPQGIPRHKHTMIQEVAERPPNLSEFRRGPCPFCAGRRLRRSGSALFIERAGRAGCLRSGVCGHLLIVPHRDSAGVGGARQLDRRSRRQGKRVEIRWSTAQDPCDELGERKGGPDAW